MMDPNQNVNVAGAAGAAPVQSTPTASSENIMAQGVSEKKKGSKGMLYGMILLAVLAIGGIGFGAWAWMDGNTQKDSLNQQISDLKKQNNELLDKIAEYENKIEEEPEVENDTEDYIYVEEWGLKIKKPENLSELWYEFEEETSQSAAALYISEEETGVRVVVYKTTTCDIQRPSDQKCFAVGDMYYIVQAPNVDETISEEFIEHFNNQENYLEI